MVQRLRPTEWMQKRPFDCWAEHLLVRNRDVLQGRVSAEVIRTNDQRIGNDAKVPTNNIYPPCYRLPNDGGLTSRRDFNGTAPSSDLEGKCGRTR